MTGRLLVVLVASLGSAGSGAQSPAVVPEWAADAVWYQVFPERFANGDPTNDPTPDSLGLGANIPAGWGVTPWGSEWAHRAAWERRASDRFEGAAGARRYGGDLRGVLDRLDYLVDLGVNALYFNPLFHAASAHKYDGASFHHIDPHFGPDPAGDLALMKRETADPATWRWTAADRLFLELVRECHTRGIRVVLDGVFNHTGREFFAFRDLAARQAESPYRDWYVVRSLDDPATPASEFRYEGWWGHEGLPIFADSADGTDLADGPKRYVLNATRRWMDPDADGDPSDGVDGWRLDVAPEVPVGFWAGWNEAVRRINPDAYTVAEHWEACSVFLHKGGFSATMNYHGFAMPVKGFAIDGRLPASEFASLLLNRALEHDEPRRHAMQNLIDSHDTERVASMAVNAARSEPYRDADRFDYDGAFSSPSAWEGYLVRAPRADERRLQRMVVVLQTTCVGAPMIYYGDEAGLWGADDPECRKPMLWPDLAYEPEAIDPLGRPRVADPVSFDGGLHDFYRYAMKMRRNTAALRRGGFEVLATDDPAQALAFRRRLGTDSAYVVVNRGDGPWAVDLVTGADGPLREAFVASGEPHRVRIDPIDRGVRVTVPEREAAVLLPKR